jgi:hypothetical protein
MLALLLHVDSGGAPRAGPKELFASIQGHIARDMA